MSIGSELEKYMTKADYNRNNFKSSIRKNILSQRENLELKEQLLLSKKIIDNFINTVYFKNKKLKGKNISLFNSIRGEPDLSVLRDYLIEKDANCYYPVTLSDEIVMSLYFPGSGEKQFSKGRLGINEPQSADFSFNEMDIVFIPGIAFDITGNRIGFGKGYYDKYLSKYPQNKRPFIIALVYDFQVLDKIPSQNHDIPVNLIVTDKRIIENRSGNEK